MEAARSLDGHPKVNHNFRRFLARPGGTMSRRVSDQVLLCALLDLAFKLRRTPREPDINAGTPYHHTTYIRHFGSLREAQRRAGLAPNPIGNFSHLDSKRAVSAHRGNA